VLRHHSANGRLDERGGEAREDRRDAAEDALVEDSALGEVSNLGRAADVSGSGQDGVLEDRAEDGVGAEALRRGIENREQVGGAVRLRRVPCPGLPAVTGLPGAVGEAAKGLTVFDARIAFDRTWVW
jgi:hypothetical protein